MTKLADRIIAFEKLGSKMRLWADGLDGKSGSFSEQYPEVSQLFNTAMQRNPWFTPESIAKSLSEWSDQLQLSLLNGWIDLYPGLSLHSEAKKIAVVMAGNIPLVGFHDFLCTLISGNKFIGKLSSDDDILLPFIAEQLCEIEPQFTDYIQFTTEKLPPFDAVIATGSNNTSRYFEYYFGDYQHIIRKNRNGIAILTGDETDAQLHALGNDICDYFGLGCRNVSKLYIPEGSDPTTIYKGIEPHTARLMQHNKYMNNYTYYRSVYLVNTLPHFDNGTVLLCNESLIASPISVIYYEFYESEAQLQQLLAEHENEIQCIANQKIKNNKFVLFGETQSPSLTDYADGVDTMDFLIAMNNR